MVSFAAVTKRYGSLTAVDNVSFEVPNGSFLALLGPNGAGKSTLVKMLLDLVRPTSGTITVDGRSSLNATAREHVGYIPENHTIPPYLTAREYLVRHAALCGITGSSARKETDRLLELVGMGGKERTRARTFSKGMAQRVGLAAAMIGNPKLLILDEPVSGLDPIGIRDIRTILQEFRDHGATIILNSHLLSEVEKTCDTAAIINKGKIVAQGTLPELVKDHETLEEVFVRVVGGNP